MITLQDYVKENKVFVVAHRGSSGTAPENTMAAYREAIEAGAKMIEIDIQFTNDNQIISFHDNKFTRTANGLVKIKDFSYEAMKDIDIGSWFHEKFHNERIPLLSEVFELIRDKAFLNIEIKPQKAGNYESKILQLIKLVKEYQFEEQVLFASFSYKLLALVKQIAPNFHVAVIKMPGDDRLPSELMNELNFDAYICSLAELNREISEDAMRNNLILGVYSVDTKQDLTKAINLNVNAIGTNFPDFIIKELISCKL